MAGHKNAIFEKDFAAVREIFPKLNCAFSSKQDAWLIKGDLDICDKAGSYWGTFKVGILVPAGYPFGIPVVWERSNLIPRQAEWHISRNGVCCLDIDHKLLEWSRRGIRLTEFMSSKVYPYFANQLYKLEKGVYAGQEYKHRFEGVAQFYKEDLCLSEAQAVIFLKLLLNRQFPGRNDPCPCGTGKKLKHCHKDSIAFLRSVGRKQMLLDLAGFQNIQEAFEKPANAQ